MSRLAVLRHHEQVRFDETWVLKGTVDSVGTGESHLILPEAVELNSDLGSRGRVVVCFGDGTRRVLSV